MKKIICLIAISCSITGQLLAKDHPGLSWENYTSGMIVGLQLPGWPANIDVIANPGDSIALVFWDCDPCGVASFCVKQWYFNGDSILNSFGVDPLNIVISQIGTYSVQVFCYPNPMTFTIIGSPTGIASFKSINFLKVFPTVVNSSITIQLNLTKQNDVSISFYEVNGKQLKNAFYKNVFGELIKNEDTEALAKGIYFIRIKAGDEMMEKKFIKM